MTDVRFHIVGLDLSLSRTGLARIRPHDPEPITLALVESAPTRGAVAPYPATLARLRQLAGDIIRTALVDREPTDVVVFVIEAPIFGTATGQFHTRAGLWWLVYHLAEKLGMVVIVEPTRLKRYITGKGNAPKDLVFATMIANHPRAGIVDNNEADALGLACMASRELGFPMEPSVQRVTPNALEGVAWPEYITQRREQNG